MIDRARLRCVALTPGAGAEAAVIATIETALSRGATSIWLRERARTSDARERLARVARDLTRAAGASLWISGDVELALVVGADSVHLGFRDVSPRSLRNRGLEALAIGFSAHDPLAVDFDWDAIEASDYVTLSPFAATAKEHGSLPPLGARRFEELVARIDVPVVALGGIDETNAATAIRAGAAGVAVLRAVPRLDHIVAAM